MASIRQRAGRWQARVIREGYEPQSKTFGSKEAALRWARDIEVSMDHGTFAAVSDAQRTRLGDLVERYLKEVTPTLKSKRDDSIRLRALLRHPICGLTMSTLTPSRLALFRDERLGGVSAGTVLRELAYLSAIINHARKEWGIYVDNPVSRVRKPQAAAGRDRLLSDAEQVVLFDALRPSGRRSPWMLSFVELALETAMRRGELLSLRWRDVNLVNRTAALHDTKNGECRVVPLSSRAAHVLASLPRSIEGRVFPLTSFAVSAAFNRALARSGIEGLRFHDLRHTAITRMASKLPNVIELAAVSGHKSLRMLQRYYHPKPEDLAQKLG